MFYNKQRMVRTYATRGAGTSCPVGVYWIKVL